MAGLNSHDSTARKPLRKPLMLKDYLLDDLSSCSSNGFRTYPRRQCCTTLRFLVDMDLKTTDSSGHGKRFLKSKSKSASTTTMSAFQRASEAVINAVKLLPFASTKSLSSASKQKKTKSSILPRSLSRKLLMRRSFWKKTDKDMQEQQQRSWKSFKYFLEQKDQSDSSPSAALASSAISTVTTATYSNSSIRETNSNSHSWSESDFTSDSLQSSSGNSDSSGENDVVASDKSASASKRVGVTVGDDSTEANSTNKWRNEEEKEQFSPVSVLDFPFEDDEEVSSSPFQHRLASMEGTRQKKLMRKTRRRFGRLAQLEAVDLEKQFSSLKEEEAQQRAVALLELLKSTRLPSVVFKFDADNLLLDFFAERMAAETEAEAEILEQKQEQEQEQEQEVLNVARDWMRGQPRDDETMSLEWEVEKNRQAYVREMERGGRWKKSETEEKEEVAMELEVELFASLLNELLDDDPMESKTQ